MNPKHCLKVLYVYSLQIRVSYFTNPTSESIHFIIEIERSSMYPAWEERHSFLLLVDLQSLCSDTNKRVDILYMRDYQMLINSNWFLVRFFYFSQIQTNWSGIQNKIYSVFVLQHWVFEYYVCQTWHSGARLWHRAANLRHQGRMWRMYINVFTKDGSAEEGIWPRTPVVQSPVIKPLNHNSIYYSDIASQ